MRPLRRVAVAVLPAAAGSLAVAGGLILGPWPGTRAPRPWPGFDKAIAADCTGLPEPRAVAMRDGRLMPLRLYPSAGPRAPLPEPVPGSGGAGMQRHRMAQALAARGVAHVAVPDLRGHGSKPERRGDVDDVGQLEDDFDDLVSTLRKPGQRIVFGGHSSGGGLVIRHAAGVGEMDAAVLVAPYLRHDAPTMREDAGGWAQPLTRRIVGLTMLNAVGISWLNHLILVHFHLSDAVLDGPHGALTTQAHTYRLTVSFAPRADWKADIARLPRFLLLTGAGDEAFRAEAYQPALAPLNPKGAHVILPGVGHLDILFDRAAGEAIATLLETP